MTSLTMKSILANKARFVLTAVAVVLGVAFMAGTLVLTDTIKKSYNDLAGNVYANTDAVVRSSRHVKSEDGDVRGTIAAATLARVRAVPGVKAAEPRQVGIAVVVAKDGSLLDNSRNRPVPIAIGWQQAPDLNPLELVSGHAPRGPDEIVIDRATARRGHFAPGDQARVLSPSGSAEFVVAGVATYGGADSAAGAPVVAFASETATRVLGTPGRYDAIDVVAQPGVSAHALVTNLQAALHGRGSGVQVITGAEAIADARTAAGAQLGFMNVFLLTFAVVALVVGSFVIYNTFSITVAQRTKETALMRAIGASRRQVRRSVMIESWFTGVFASAAGIVVGIGAAAGLRIMLTSFGIALPKAPTVVQPRTVITSMIVGTLVTVVAAWLPSRKAAKVPPIAAMRDVELDSSGASMRRAVIGVLVTVVGALLLGFGLSAGAAGTVGLGALAVFFGVTILGPVIARPFAHALGLPLPRLRGMAGTLARENATRNPRRTAATASALMIGVGLVAFITVFGASLRMGISSTVDTYVRSDWIVETQWGMGGLSPAATQRVDALPETAAVTPLRFVTPKVAGSAADVVAFDPARIGQHARLDVRAGDIARLGEHDVAIQADEAKARGTHLGDTITMTFPETGPQRLRVAAVYGTKDLLGAYAIDLHTFDANVTTHVDDVVLVRNAPGVSTPQARHAIDRALKDYPNASVQTRDEFKGAIAVQINKLLNLVYALLAMALLIALFGIANTLALSVFERTREFGLLRAVGMSRAQVRTTVRWESVLISLLGTALGLAIGVGFGWALVQAAAGSQLALSIPMRNLAFVVVLASIAAVVAAALPARRAARLDILHAVTQ